MGRSLEPGFADEGDEGGAIAEAELGEDDVDAIEVQIFPGCDCGLYGHGTWGGRFLKLGDEHRLWGI